MNRLILSPGGAKDGSPGHKPWGCQYKTVSAPEGRHNRSFAPPGLKGRQERSIFPGLTPWATIFRPSGAKTKAILAVCLALVISSVHADTIHRRSADSIRYVKIMSFTQGRLEALDAKTAERKSIEYADVALLRVDGQPEVNDAEKSLLAHQLDAAAGGYQKVLDKLGAAGPPWLKVWVKVRRLNLFAATGQVDRMTEAYLDLAKQIPDWLILVAPTRQDIKATDAQLEQTARRLTEARGDSKSDKTREALLKFYQRIGRGKPAPPVKDMRAADLDEKDFEKNDQPGPWLDVWADKKIKAGHPDAVLRVTTRLLGTALRRNLPAVFYWQGRAQLAQGDHEDAALSFLQVAIEFPAGDYAAPALFHAARAATETGHIDYARRLVRELIDSYSNSNDYTIIQLVEQARDMMHEKE